MIFNHYNLIRDNNFLYLLVSTSSLINIFDNRKKPKTPQDYSRASELIKLSKWRGDIHGG